MITSVAKIAALTLAIPTTLIAAYLLYLNHKVSPQVIAGTRVRHTPWNKFTSITRKPTCTPPDVANENSEWILAEERVTSRPVALSHLEPTSLSFLLTKYIRATMTAFGNTPQVYLLRRMMPREDIVAESFSRERIRSLEFDVGHLVYGVWRVAHRGGDSDEKERVELAMEAPAGYRGPVVEGVVVVGVERVDEEHVVFVNEMWMWRRPGQKKVMLESAAGRWFHTLLSSWLVVRGVEALTGVGLEGGENL